MKLMVGLDALTPPLAGIGYYTLNLLREFREAAGIELNGISTQGLWSSAQIDQAIAEEEALASVVTNHKRDIKQRARVAVREWPAAYRAAKWWRNRKCGELLSRVDSRSLYHEPNFVDYPFSGRTVITVHDLSHIRYPEAHPSSRVAYLNRYLPQSVKQASAIIAVSDSTKQEMLKLGLVDQPSRIHVTHLGCEPGFHPRSAEETQACRERLGLRWRGFVLSVATLEPRKNIERLLQAYQALPSSLAREFPLVLVGGDGWKDSGLKRMIAEVRSPHQVIVTGYLPRSDVQELMAAAAVFAYPSLYEGFGLPVLEAMASGTAVLTSEDSSLGEVAGDGALTVPPRETTAIQEGLISLLGSEALRDKLCRLGLQRSKAFSWKRCAEQTLDVYRSLG